MDLITVPFTPSLSLSDKIPPELWDKVIDAIDEERDAKTGLLPEDTRRALINCALVCHDWNKRATYHLNRWIHIGDANALTGLTERMGSASRILCPHIETLHVRLPGVWHYPPNNVLTFLPTLFRQGISSITKLDVGVHLSFEGHLIPQGNKKIVILLPYLPLHPRWPSLVTPVLSTVRYLHMWFTKFKNFSDFGKFLNCFQGLEVLNCDHVGWHTLGVIPGCITRKTRRTFLQNLRELRVRVHHPICFLYTRTHMSHIALWSPRPWSQ